MGSLGALEYLGLGLNQIGNTGMAALSLAITSGALGMLENLGLSENQIGDDGMATFSSAIANGALPKLVEVFGLGNPGNGMGVEEACRARGIRCLM